MSRTYHIWTIGCQMNEADSRRLAQQLEFAGYHATEEAKQADVIVLNTCVVRQQAEDKALSLLGRFRACKDRNPNTVIGLMGCMVGMREAPALQKRFPFVDVFMPPSETVPLLDFLQEKGLLEDARQEEARDRAWRDAIQDEDLPLPIPEQGNAVTAHVPVVLGCSHACTFCVIPYRRGAERSRRPQEIINEVKSLVRQGVREITLLGQIVDRYGMDFNDGTSLSSLMKEIAKIDELYRLRFLTGHPNYMTDELLETVASTEKICPHIEVPVQAGNNEVLQNMMRGYTQEQYRALIEKIRAIVPAAAIHTDIIVGFPGETEAQFMDTYRLLEDLKFDKAHLFQYSVRPKTIASRKLPDDVPAEEKQRRWELLEKMQRGICDEKNKALRGQTVQVLVEDVFKGKWRGRTPQNKLVYFEDPNDLRGQLVDVAIDWSAPFSLMGKRAKREIPILA